jgi:hypothetical protein
VDHPDARPVSRRRIHHPRADRRRGWLRKRDGREVLPLARHLDGGGRFRRGAFDGPNGSGSGGWLGPLMPATDHGRTPEAGGHPGVTWPPIGISVMEASG